MWDCSTTGMIHKAKIVMFAVLESTGVEHEGSSSLCSGPQEVYSSCSNSSRHSDEA